MTVQAPYTYSVTMKSADIKTDIQTSFGSVLTNFTEGNHTIETDFGHFSCSVQAYDHLRIIRRNFETSGDSVDIPFSCSEPCVQMIFSLNGQSFFNNRVDPFFMGSSSHCINFFREYECVNLLGDRSTQHDINVRLSKGFYHELITNYLSSAEDRLPVMIAREQAFNTINQHIPLDPAILGILNNIMNCPFEGGMKDVFIREHVKALFTLQLFHFNAIVTGEPVKLDSRINARDRDILFAVKDYIDQHFLNPASLDSLSREFGLNEFKLKLGFRKLFDTSPMRYLQHKRLTFALFLLRETDKTIKEISDEIGYSHAANFTTAFTKMFGNSPQHYRQLREIVTD